MYAVGLYPLVWKDLSFSLCKMGVQTFVLPSLKGGGDLLG